MKKDEERDLSKLMSFILRHRPDKFGIELIEGFCQLDDLLAVINKQKQWENATLDDIKTVVKNCPKQRYLIEDDKIRANYGHSSVKVEYNSSKPPKKLLHGTNDNVVHVILSEGLKKMGRSYVHLSEDYDFAKLAGERRGKLVIIEVDSEKAHNEGIKFYKSENGVWLADFVPPQYLSRR